MTFKEIRRKYKKTVEEVSELTSIPISTIREYECGAKVPSLRRFLILKELYEKFVEAEELLVAAEENLRMNEKYRKKVSV